MTTLSAPAGLSALSGTYALDTTHTRIGFVARHAMVTKVRGSFKEFDAQVHIDATRPEASTATVTMKAASIDTGQEQRDAHLRSGDFLEADTYPTSPSSPPRWKSSTTSGSASLATSRSSTPPSR